MAQVYCDLAGSGKKMEEGKQVEVIIESAEMVVVEDENKRRTPERFTQRALCSPSDLCNAETKDIFLDDDREGWEGLFELFPLSAWLEYFVTLALFLLVLLCYNANTLYLQAPSLVRCPFPNCGEFHSGILTIFRCRCKYPPNLLFICRNDSNMLNCFCGECKYIAFLNSSMTQITCKKLAPFLRYRGAIFLLRGRFFACTPHITFPFGLLRREEANAGQRRL